MSLETEVKNTKHGKIAIVRCSAGCITVRLCKKGQGFYPSHKNWVKSCKELHLQRTKERGQTIEFTMSDCANFTTEEFKDFLEEIGKAQEMIENV